MAPSDFFLSFFPISKLPPVLIKIIYFEDQSIYALYVYLKVQNEDFAYGY